jgi:hypothetical protein
MFTAPGYIYDVERLEIETGIAPQPLPNASDRAETASSAATARPLAMAGAKSPAFLRFVTV